MQDHKVLVLMGQGVIMKFVFHGTQVQVLILGFS